VVSDDVRAQLRRSGLVDRVGEDGFFARAGDALDSYRIRVQQ
jgi:hypothetical protein